MKDQLVVDIRNLAVEFETIDGVLKVLNGVDLVVSEGEMIGIVGETGCGKSVTAKLLLGILPMPPGRIRKGEIYFLGHNLLNARGKERKVLQEKIAYVPQDPMASLNPVFQIGTLMVDMIVWKMSDQRTDMYLWKRRKKTFRQMAEDLAVTLLKRVEIPDPKSVLTKYPIELSGGMRQRALLAMALIGNPKLIIADEPTTALDVTIQKKTLLLFQGKVKEDRLSGIYITHNLGVARIMCHRTYVMYAGTIVESGKTGQLLDTPLHPYTRGLINSIPRLTGVQFKGIEGQIPDYLAPPPGCRFHPRCPQRSKLCSEEAPKLVQVEEDRFVACRHLY